MYVIVTVTQFASFMVATEFLNLIDDFFQTSEIVWLGLIHIILS